MRADRPSLTALGVALARAGLDRPSTPTGDPDGEAALTASLLADAGDGRSAALEGWDQASVLDFLGFLTARTEFFDAAVLRALETGANQVVILGAGYDGRALRFRTPGVRFFEVDHPATQADKRARLDGAGVATDGITFVSADFTEPGLAEALEAAGHRAGEPTLFLCEGLLRYLPEHWFRQLLAVTAGRAAPGSELAASIITRPAVEDPARAAARRRQDRHLAESGEPVFTVPERDVIERWLNEAGWRPGSVADVADRRPETDPGRLLVLARPRP